MTDALPAAPGGGTTWRDPKRYLWLLGLVVPCFPFLAWALSSLTGLGLFWWIGPAIVYGLFPVLDRVIGKDSENPPDSALAYLERDRYYRWCTYLYLPLQYAGLVLACRWWSGSDLTGVDKIGLALTVAMVGGIGINTAHELGHKKETAERRLAKIALAQTGYGHFYIEHNRGHHVNVATPEDPASSKLGESFWRFLPRTALGSLRSAWRLEKGRMERLGIHVLHPRNDVVNAWGLTLLLFVALTGIFGVEVLPYLLLQAVVGASLLEVVNYIEHYGLLRQRVAGGRYERCTPQHSWNSNNVASNVFLYHLQRHSDHHANPTRRYQALRHDDHAPELPSGYATMIVLAYVPPLWRSVMDPRVQAHYRGDLSMANVHRPERARIAPALDADL